MSSFPQGVIETKFGQVRFTMTEATHVHLYTDRGESITIRGVEYHIAYHCHLIDGKWKEKDWHDPYLSRMDHKEASHAARKAAREVIAAAWTEYLAKHPALPVEAARDSLRNEIERLDSKMEDLTNEYTKLEQERRKLSHLLADLDERGAA